MNYHPELVLLDDDLVEAAVSLSARERVPAVTPAEQRRFDAERERCYEIHDTDERNAAFARVSSAWFRRWGLETRLLSVLERCANLSSAHLGNLRLAFRRARNPPDEGSELFVNPQGERRGVVALRAERLLSDEALAAFLHHELMHLGDMIDPAFGYSPDLGLDGRFDLPPRLIQERYRLLWNVSIDGRLANAGWSTVSTKERRRAEYRRVFGFLGEAEGRESFDALWNGKHPRHEALIEMATCARGAGSTPRDELGAPCPLCGFATFQWQDVRQLTSADLAAIEKAFPQWRAGDGLCLRCAEIYASLRFNSPQTQEK